MEKIDHMNEFNAHYFNAEEYMCVGDALDPSIMEDMKYKRNETKKHLKFATWSEELMFDKTFAMGYFANYMRI